MGDPAVAYGALQRPHHVILAPYLVEASRAKPPVERDEGDIGHGRRAYRCALTQTPVRGVPEIGAGARCGGQVGYGTRPYPLRAAAFRP